jgi:predicted DNA binding CopG/RHH family protein
MATKRIIPSFSSEAEEAQWWFEHSDELDKDFEQAAADGTLGQARTAQRFGLTSNIVLLTPKDAAMAREQAAKQGIAYEAYVKNLLHEALEQVAKAS